MSFRIPTADHPAREFLGDMAHVADVLNPANLSRMATFSDALRSARKSFEAEPAQRAVYVICLRCENDERWLIRVGKRGGWRKIWNFGNGRD